MNHKHKMSDLFKTSDYNRGLTVYNNYDNPFSRKLVSLYNNHNNEFSNTQMNYLKKAINLAYQAGQYNERKKRIKQLEHDPEYEDIIDDEYE